MDALSNIDRVRLIAHGDLGVDEPEGGNVVSLTAARRVRAEARRRRTEREGEYDNAG